MRAEPVPMRARNAWRLCSSTTMGICVFMEPPCTDALNRKLALGGTPRFTLPEPLFSYQKQLGDGLPSMVSEPEPVRALSVLPAPRILIEPLPVFAVTRPDG